MTAQPDGTVQINRDHAPPGGWEEFTVETRLRSNPGMHTTFSIEVRSREIQRAADGRHREPIMHHPVAGKTSSSP